MKLTALDALLADFREQLHQPVSSSFKRRLLRQAFARTRIAGSLAADAALGAEHHSMT
jgi:hypothetical protein